MPAPIASSSTSRFPIPRFTRGDLDEIMSKMRPLDVDEISKELRDPDVPLFPFPEDGA